MAEKKEIEFMQLVEGNQGIIHKICRTYTSNQMEHDDLFQEIVLQLWRSYDTFKGDSKFTTWMYRVGFNTAVTLYRRKKKKPDDKSLDDSFIQVRVDEYDEVMDERLKWLYTSIKKLNEIERALVLLYLDDLSHKEIAETLGITEVNARVKLNRIKNKLKEMIPDGI